MSSSVELTGNPSISQRSTRLGLLSVPLAWVYLCPDCLALLTLTFLYSRMGGGMLKTWLADPASLTSIGAEAIPELT